MKKTIYTIGLISLLAPFSIKALTGDVTVECDKAKLLAGESATCSVKANITEKVSAVSAKVDLGNNLELVSFTADKAWQGDGENGSIELYTDTNKSGKFDIGTIVVKAGKTKGVNTSVGLKEVKLTDDNFEESDKTVKAFDIRIPSELKSLKINKEEIKLTSGTYTYDVEVKNDVTSADIEATIAIPDGDKTSTLKFVDEFGSRTVKDLKEGKNEVLIKITDASGATDVYTINITRKAKETNTTTTTDNKDKSTTTNTTTTTNNKDKSTTSNPRTGIFGASLTLVIASIAGYILVKKKDLFKKNI